MGTLIAMSTMIAQPHHSMPIRNFFPHPPPLDQLPVRRSLMRAERRGPDGDRFARSFPLLPFTLR